MANTINKDMMGIVRNAARYAVEGVEIFDMCTWGDNGKPLEWGVNWCAKGTQSAGVARDYAAKLARAAAIAEMLAGLKMVLVCKPDEGLAQVVESAGTKTACNCYHNISLLAAEYIKALDADGLKALVLNR